MVTSRYPYHEKRQFSVAASSVFTGSFVLAYKRARIYSSIERPTRHEILRANRNRNAEFISQTSSADIPWPENFRRGNRCESSPFGTRVSRTANLNLGTRRPLCSRELVAHASTFAASHTVVTRRQSAHPIYRTRQSPRVAFSTSSRAHTRAYAHARLFPPPVARCLARVTHTSELACCTSG